MKHPVFCFEFPISTQLNHWGYVKMSFETELSQPLKLQIVIHSKAGEFDCEKKLVRTHNLTLLVTIGTAHWDNWEWRFRGD